jgi:hypothetical protein
LARDFSRELPWDPPEIPLGFFWASSGLLLGFFWAFPGLFLGFSWAFPGLFLGFSWAFPGRNKRLPSHIPGTSPLEGTEHRLGIIKNVGIIVVRR